jgi:rhomboid protease GluP
MCPNCRAFITTDDKVCPYCDIKLGARAIDLRMPDGALGGLIPAARFVNTIILIINSGIYAALMLTTINAGNERGLTDIDANTLISFGAMFAPRVYYGEVWRLVTAGFLHGGLFHIISNTYAMFAVGADVEETYGSSRMAVIYLLATIAGFGLSYWMRPALSMGASAGVFGLIGAMLAWARTNKRTAAGEAVGDMYMRWILFGAVLSVMSRTDVWAHAGGFVAGYAVGWIAGEPGRGGWRDRIWDGAAALCAAIFVISLMPVAQGLLTTAGSE